MADIRCPVCPEGIDCEHDQEERATLCRIKGVEPETIPEVFNSADPAQVQQKTVRSKRIGQQRDNDLRAVMKTGEGRRFIWAHLERCGVRRISFQPSNPDAMTTAFNEGARNVGLLLLADLVRVSKPEYLAMLKEQDGDV